MEKLNKFSGIIGLIALGLAIYTIVAVNKKQDKPIEDAVDTTEKPGK